MPFPVNPLKDFDFSQKLCLNCDSPIETGLFCANCPPEDVLDPPAQEWMVRVMELGLGEVAYVSALKALFIAGGELMINGEADASWRSGPGFTVRVRRRSNGDFAFDVDKKTYAEWEIWRGVPKPMPIATFVCEVVAF